MYIYWIFVLVGRECGLLSVCVRYVYVFIAVETWFLLDCIQTAAWLLGLLLGVVEVRFLDVGQQIVHRQLELRVHEAPIRADLVSKAREFPEKSRKDKGEIVARKLGLNV